MIEFIVNTPYWDRRGHVWKCVKPKFGSLPEFENILGHRIVRAHDGRYRFDGVNNPRDIVPFEEEQ